MFDCYACNVTAQGDDAPRWERIYADEHWRVAHAYDSSLLGWLVVLARRHVESLADLTEQEAAALGPLLRSLSAALRAETGASKSYVMLFAEHPRHQHLHIHVVPRMPDLPADRRGPEIFHYLAALDREIVPEDQRNEFAAGLRKQLDLGGVSADSRSHPG